MRPFNDISLDLIKSLFVIDTNSATGLAWKKNSKQAGTFIKSSGYCQVKIPTKFTEGENLFVYIHRINWMLDNDREIPVGYHVDHRDTIRCNNKPTNLRLATIVENSANRLHDRIKATGLPSNIFKNKRGYFAKVVFNSVCYRSAEHSSIELAQQWLQNKRRELHGSFYKPMV